MLEEPREERDVSMNAYVRKQAGKEIIRHYLERMGEAMPDPVPYAREMFSRKVVSKLTLELAEPSDLPIENRSTSFISSMYSAIERDYRNFYQFLEVLRMWPNTVAIADVVEKAYSEDLVIYVSLSVFYLLLVFQMTCWTSGTWNSILRCLRFFVSYSI